MKPRQGQTTIEFVILLGFVVLAIYFMGPAFKRGVQSLVKVSADQIGNQSKSDQDVNRPLDANGNPLLVKDGEDGSFMAEAHSYSKVSGRKMSTDRIGIYNTVIDEASETGSRTVTDMGFTKQ